MASAFSNRDEPRELPAPKAGLSGGDPGSGPDIQSEEFVAMFRVFLKEVEGIFGVEPRTRQMLADALGRFADRL